MDPVKVIANTISTLTILTSAFLKVPQIKRIIARKSAEGMNVTAMLMEITGFTTVILYNFTNHYSVMTYLEYPIILVQVFTLLHYTLLYKNMLDNSMIPVVAGTYLAVVFSFAVGLLPKVLLACFMPFVTPINGMAKVSYIYGIIKAGNANAISTTTWIISVATNISRLFTIYVDSADSMLLFNISVSTILSLGVLSTTLFFKHGARFKKEKDSDEDEKLDAHVKEQRRRRRRVH